MSRAEDRRTPRDAPASPTTPTPPIATDVEVRAVRWVRWLVIGVGCGVVAGFLGGLWQPRTEQPLHQGEPLVDGERGDR